MFSRDQLKRAAALTDEDFVQLGRCRRPHNRLRFAYQVALRAALGALPTTAAFRALRGTGLLQRGAAGA
jgi:hypothetical protein